MGTEKRKVVFKLTLNEILHMDTEMPRLCGSYGNSSEVQALTLETVIQLIFAKDDSQVMHSTSMELHPEDHIPRWAPVTLVVALELEGEKIQIQIINSSDR